MFRPLSRFSRSCSTPSLRTDANDSYYAFHREINRLFDDFFSDFGAPSYFTGDRGTHRGVRIDIKDTGEAYELEAELPGVEEEDIDVELADTVLTIRAEKKLEEQEESGSRRAHSSFHRSLSLPFDVDPDAVEALFKNGVLKLTLPKPPELETKSRKIEVRRG
jgi:HSP20 family protein